MVSKLLKLRLSFGLWFLLILIFLGLNLSHLLEFTPIWPDESIFGDVAFNLLKMGQISTELWKGIFLGVTQHAFWYPPIFFYLLAFWFRIFGFSIISQRYLSLFISILFITIFFICSRFLIGKEIPKLSKTKVSLFSFLGSLFLIVDPTFLRSATISRPEILVLTLVTCSAMLVIKFLDSKIKAPLKIILMVISGLLIGISMLIHFLAGIFFLSFVLYLMFLSPKKIISEKRYYFIVAALVPIVIWILTILPELNILRSQLGVVAQGRNLTPNWLNLSFTVLPPLHRAVFLIYLIITLTFFTICLLIKKSNLILIGLILGASWIFAYYGQIEWYAVYITPLIYLTLILMLVLLNNYKKIIFFKDLKFLPTSILVVLFFIDLNNYINYATDSADKSYLEVMKSVRTVVPPGKTVFLSSIPDMYYAFKSDANYKLYETPMAKTEKGDFEDLLASLDYVVLNMRISDSFTGNMLYEYLKENAAETIKVSSGGYSVFVYKLKRKN
ncbi:MAG: glycosyltransferase family 39 protein [Actinobacteria bacterium]|nr:glycosyltransferase family 39 protein [Actinomycetota bacterium]